MKFMTLLQELKYQVQKRDVDIEITTLVSDSRKVVPGSVFVALKGANFDGHFYIDEVIQKGAVAVVVQQEIHEVDAVVVRVEDTRYAYALMSAAYFGYPARELFTIGITGTKGKTTTTYMVKNVLEACGIPTGLIGTIETIFGEERVPSKNTTPESFEVHQAFRKMVDAGCKAVVMEVSSQGLMQHRTAGIVFDIGVFTNLEKDHIGPNEHSSMEQYMECKSMLFRQCKKGIVNGDDPHLEKILQNHTCEVETYGIHKPADLRARDIQYIHKAGELGTNYCVEGKMSMDISLKMPGIFSVYNSLCAIAITRQFSVAPEILQQALSSVWVKGRIEIVPVSKDYTVIIDYAHNAMSLESILRTLREYNPGRLVCMFGCGGNRSKDRRYEMGQVSGQLADLTVITSDNPRNEEPQEIIDDIKVGIGRTEGSYVEIINRKDAIKYCIQNGKKGDIILFAGKGHEDYQEIRGVKYPMDERVLISEVMDELCMQKL